MNSLTDLWNSSSPVIYEATMFDVKHFMSASISFVLASPDWINESFVLLMTTVLKVNPIAGLRADVLLVCLGPVWLVLIQEVHNGWTLIA